MYFIPWHLPSGPDFWQDHTHFEDAMDAFHQIFYIPTLTFAFLGIIISIGLFNLTGLSVTREVNATTRVILQNVRIVLVWLIGLTIEWQLFTCFQPIGCVLIIVGILIYCNVVFFPGIRKLYYCIVKNKENNTFGIEPLIQVIPRWRRNH